MSIKRCIDITFVDEFHKYRVNAQDELDTQCTSQQ